MFCLLLLQAVQDCCSWGLAREGWQEHGKRKDVGGIVIDKTALHKKAFRRRERGALGSIIMASSGKEKEWGEASWGVLFFLACLSVSSLFSDLLDIFEITFLAVCLVVCLCVLLQFFCFPYIDFTTDIEKK